MKAVRIDQPNQIQMIEVAPQRPGNGEILIQVMASGICGTDIHIYRGEYMGSYPVIPGHEFAGTILETGAGVIRFKPATGWPSSRTLRAITAPAA